MSKNIPKISQSEWIVLNALWADAPATANELVERLGEKNTWNPRTVKTLINRLVKKKAVGFEKRGREYLYFPLIDRSKCAKAEGRSFLRRVYGGSLKPMLAGLIEDEAISAEEIDELKAILENKGKSK